MRLFSYILLLFLASCSFPDKTAQDSNATSARDYRISREKNRCILEFVKILKPINNASLAVVAVALSDPEIRFRCPEVIIKLDSTGGDISTANKIAELVRSSNVSTLAPSGRSCASACTSIFIAGVKRYVVSTWMLKDSEIGFHRSLIKKSNGEWYCAAPNSRETEDALIFARRYTSEQAARKFHEYTFNTPCNDMKWISAKDLILNKIATDVF